MAKITFYTHSGPARGDEYWAIAAIIAAEDIDMKDIEVKRIRDIEEIERGGKVQSFLVDIGNDFDPCNNCYDHHQMNTPTVSSFSLVVDSYPELDKMKSVNKDFSKLVERVTYQDHGGVAYLASRTRASQVFLSSMLQVEMIMLERFETAPRSALEPAVMWLSKKLEGLNVFDQLIRYINQNSRDDLASNMLVIESWPKDMDLDKTTAIEAMQYTASEKVNDIDITISQDVSNNNPGCYYAFRNPIGAGKYDLSRLSGPELSGHLRFVHTKGRLAVFEPHITVDEIVNKFLPLAEVDRSGGNQNI